MNRKKKKKNSIYFEIDIFYNYVIMYLLSLCKSVIINGFNGCFWSIYYVLAENSKFFKSKIA